MGFVTQATSTDPPGSCDSHRPANDRSFYIFLAATAILLGLSSFAFHACFYFKHGTYDSYYPMLNEDEIVYTGQVNAARNGRVDGDLFLYEYRDRPNMFEKLPARVFANISAAAHVPAYLLPVFPDLVMPAVNLLIFFFFFSAFTKDRMAALFLALSYYVLFPTFFICLYTPVRGFLFGSHAWVFPTLKEFVNSPNLTRFYPAQFTQVFFFFGVMALARLLRRRNLASVALAGAAVGIDFYIRVYDAIVLSILVALLAVFYAARKDYSLVKRLAGVIAVLTLIAVPYLLDHHRLGASPYYFQYIERVVIDIGTREFLWGRFGLFLIGTLGAAAVFYRVLRTRTEEVHHLFFFLLPASWLPYFLNVILGYNINRSHWLWYHILPFATSLILFSAVEYLRGRVSVPAFKKGIVLAVAGLLLFHFVYSFVPYAREPEYYQLPDGIRETFHFLNDHTVPEEVVASTFFPFVQITYTNNWSFLPYSAYSTATNDELLRRYLLFKKLYYGSAFKPRIYEMLRRPFDPAPLANLAPYHFHFDFPERANEFTQLRYTYDAGYEVKPHLRALLPYKDEYEPEFISTLATRKTSVYYLSIEGRKILESVNSIEDDPDAILQTIAASYRLDYVLLRPWDIRQMPAGWLDKIERSKSLTLIYSRDGYYVFKRP